MHSHSHADDHGHRNEHGHDHGHSHGGHSHGGHGHSAERGLSVTLLLQLGIFTLETVGGFWAHSLSLLSDAGHVLTDVLALGLSLYAMRLATRPAKGRHTFGYHRAEILAAMANGLTLVFVSLFIFREAYLRYLDPPAIDVRSMIIIASIGLCGNGLGMYWMLSAHRTANVRSILLHLAGDALSSAGVVIGGIVIFFTHLLVVDLIVSVLVGLIVMLGALNLLRDVVEILLETAPPGLDSEKIISAMQTVTGVRQVHEFHLWRVTHEMPALSAHIDVDPSIDRDRILADLQALLANRFDVRHTTLQIEIDRLVPMPTSRLVRRGPEPVA